MTRRLWFMSNPTTRQPRLTRADGIPEASVKSVTVREAGDGIAYDGVWVNGERSYDTWVLLNGQVVLHSPVATVGSASFEQHEHRGGGHAL